MPNIFEKAKFFYASSLFILQNGELLQNIIYFHCCEYTNIGIKLFVK